MTMEEYMAMTRTKCHILKDLRETPLSGKDDDDANEHIKKVLEIFDMFNLPGVTSDQIMLTIFPKTIIGGTLRWFKSERTGSITTWELVESKFLAKYCPPSKTAKKFEEIYNFE